MCAALPNTNSCKFRFVDRNRTCQVLKYIGTYHKGVSTGILMTNEAVHLNEQISTTLYFPKLDQRLFNDLVSSLWQSTKSGADLSHDHEAGK
jgi:hypothetical protein